MKFLGLILRAPTCVTAPLIFISFLSICLITFRAIAPAATRVAVSRADDLPPPWEACEKLKRVRLSEFDLYVTLEPCIMCAAAISQARIRRLYFGSDDLKYGSINGNINYFQRENTNHLPEIYDNICSESCNKLLTDFFKERR